MVEGNLLELGFKQVFLVEQQHKVCVSQIGVVCYLRESMQTVL